MVHQRIGKRGRRAAALAFIAWVGSMAWGCGKKADESGAADTQPKTAAPGVQAKDDAVSTTQVATDVPKPLTAEEYEGLLLGLASCSIVGEHIDPKCEAKKAFNDTRTRAHTLADMAGLTARLGKKYLKHESPAVRVQAAAFLTSVFGADPSSQALVIEAARTEKDPAVIAAMLQAVGSKGGANPDIGKLLLDMADHAEPAVRKKAVVWLGSSWNEKVEGSIEKLIAKVDSDPDPEVRAFACKYSGDRGDDRLIPTYDKYTKDPTADPKLYAACMEGLLDSWMHYPLFQTYSEKAYKLSIKRLGHTPRSKEVPPWTLMDNFAELAKDSNKKLVEWKAKATWFKPKEVLVVLEPIVVDPQAYRLARSGALQSMVALGATKQQLENMRAAYGEAQGFDDQSIAKALDEAIAAAK